jgi:hypothetical protein
MRRLSAIVLAAAVTMVAPALAAARPLPGTPVPRGFVGMNVDGPMLTGQDGVAYPSQFGVMRANGVQSVRAVFSWSVAQPYASWAQVPASQSGMFLNGAGGVPTNFAGTDQIVGLAAAQGLTVLPTVIGAPSWDAGTMTALGLAPPRDNQPYASYLTTLIGRYGPSGSFWSQHPNLPRRPIRMWEVWNEPNLIQFWPMRPWPSSYVALLRAAHGAIKKADPRAKVVLAALPNYSWRLLLQIYRVAGARRLFDVVDVHAYTKNPAGVIQILGFVRTSMKLGKDTNKQLIAGEVGWLSSGNQTARQYDFQTTQAGQARNLRTLLPLLAANRKALRLSAFYWYTWMGDEFRGANPFNFSGLVALQNGQVKTKPALKAFNQTARALER